LIGLFTGLSSFDLDPDIEEPTLLEEGESYIFSKVVDRSLRWLTDKICEANLDPIIVTLDQPGDSKEEIIQALEDKRSA